jgi:hypothetical protein
MAARWCVVRMRVTWEDGSVGNRWGRGCGGVSNMGELRRVLTAVILGMHHGSVEAFMPLRRACIALILIFVVVAAAKVGGSLVLVGAAMELISCNQVAHVCRGVFVKLLIVAKDKDSHIDGAKDGELMSLLEQSTFALEECY